MNAASVISLCGGIALFLFGMSLMGEGLKKVAGNKMEIILFRLSSTPLKGLLLGAGVTAVIQSSSATSVMVVGFVNSGIMQLTQAIAVIIGSIIGTSVTGWIICLSSVSGSGWISLFSTATLSSAVAVAGILMRMFSKSTQKKHVGEILLGFAVLMYGIQAMSSAVSPLRESETFISFMTGFSNPVLGILAGVVFAAVLQSASAAVGILQALSTTGTITFEIAFPILLGISIGASVPVLLSAIGAKTVGRRSAWSYLIISVFSSLLAGTVYYISDGISHLEFSREIMSPFSIALINTVFRAVSGFALIPFISFISKVLTSLIRESEKEAAADSLFERLDERFLAHPALAVEQSGATVSAMAETAKENLLSAISLIGDFDDERFNAIAEAEELVDRFEDKIGTYLLKLNTVELTPDQNERVSEYLHTLSDFERISDHALNIAESAKELHEKSISFSEEAAHEMNTLCAAIKEILEISFGAFLNGDDEAQYSVEPLEECIDTMCDTMKRNHTERMQKGKCTIPQGFVFNDLLTDFERVADHCSNIAVAMIEITGDSFATHSYIEDLKQIHSHNFNELLAAYCEKYSF